MTKTVTLERMIPDALEEGNVLEAEILDLHIARYEFAKSFVREKTVLDLACGVGYGSQMLADTAASVMGVDLSEEAILYAKERYHKEVISYHACSYERMRAQIEECPDDGFDVVVSLETIEHVPDPDDFLHHLVSWVRPGGLLVAAVPVTPTVDYNPFHLHDFTEKQWKAMIRNSGLTIEDTFKQIHKVSFSTWKGSQVKGERHWEKEMRQNLPAFYLRHPDKFFSRLGALMRYGLSTHYLTIVGRRGV